MLSFVVPLLIITVASASSLVTYTHLSELSSGSSSSFKQRGNSLWFMTKTLQKGFETKVYRTDGTVKGTTSGVTLPSYPYSLTVISDTQACATLNVMDTTIYCIDGTQYINNITLSMANTEHYDYYLDDYLILKIFGAKPDPIDIWYINMKTKQETKVSELSSHYAQQIAIVGNSFFVNSGELGAALYRVTPSTGEVKLLRDFSHEIDLKYGRALETTANRVYIKLHFNETAKNTTYYAYDVNRDELFAAATLFENDYPRVFTPAPTANNTDRFIINADHAVLVCNGDGQPCDRIPLPTYHNVETSVYVQELERYYFVLRKTNNVQNFLYTLNGNNLEFLTTISDQLDAQLWISAIKYLPVKKQIGVLEQNYHPREYKSYRNQLLLINRDMNGNQTISLCASDNDPVCNYWSNTFFVMPNDAIIAQRTENGNDYVVRIDISYAPTTATPTTKAPTPGEPDPYWYHWIIAVSVSCACFLVALGIMIYVFAKERMNKPRLESYYDIK
jgi:hypothetical protein